MIFIRNRQLELILYLNQKKKTTLEELSLKFEVSKRTIMRDLDELSALGVPVYTRKGYGGGVYLDEDYQFDQSFFTPGEISDLVLALHIADRLVHGKKKSTLLKKLELLLPKLTLEKENDFLEYVKVDPLLEDFDLADPVVQTINRGLDEEICLDITFEGKSIKAAPLYYSLKAAGMTLCVSDGQKQYFLPLSAITACSATELEFERENFREFLGR